MNITIDSQDLLDILLDAGIQVVDAKALILDILTLQENNNKPKTPKQPPTTPAQPARLRPVETRPEAKATYGDTVSASEEALVPLEDEGTEEEEVEERKPTVTRVQGRTVGSRPKFDGFGGDSTGALRR